MYSAPTHPGEMLLEEWMKPAGWTVGALAGRMGVKPGELRLLLEQRVPVTPELARRLSTALDTSPDLWLNLQATWDAWHMAHR
jgi:addiction module HigA family antidote